MTIALQQKQPQRRQRMSALFCRSCTHTVKQLRFCYFVVVTKKVNIGKVTTTTLLLLRGL